MLERFSEPADPPVEDAIGVPPVEDDAMEIFDQSGRAYTLPKAEAEARIARYGFSAIWPIPLPTAAE